jgi:hypothetical protein
MNGRRLRGAGSVAALVQSGTGEERQPPETESRIDSPEWGPMYQRSYR